MKHLVLVIFLFSISVVKAQKDKTIFFGVNVGVKFANKNYATRYNGLYQNGLENALYNTYNYQEIYQMLGDKHFELSEVPGNIRYTPGLLTGLIAGYQLSPNLQANIDANFSKLKVRDVYTIVIYDPSNWTSEPVIGTGNLYAEESRFNGRFNFDYIGDGDKTKFIFGVSGVFSAWRIDEFFAEYQGYTMPLFSKHSPNNNLGNVVSGTGWGGGINIGVEYRVNDKIVAQVMYQPYQTWLDYDVYIEKKLLLQHDLSVRFLWK